MAQTPDTNQAPADPFGPNDIPASSSDHYNTLYIVANLKRNELRTKLIGIGIAAALVAGVVAWAAMREAPPPPKLSTVTAAPSEPAPGAKAGH